MSTIAVAATVALALMALVTFAPRRSHRPVRRPAAVTPPVPTPAPTPAPAPIPRPRTPADPRLERAADVRIAHVRAAAALLASAAPAPGPVPTRSPQRPVTPAPRTAARR